MIHGKWVFTAPFHWCGAWWQSTKLTVNSEKNFLFSTILIPHEILNKGNGCNFHFLQQEPGVGLRRVPPISWCACADREGYLLAGDFVCIQIQGICGVGDVNCYCVCSPYLASVSIVSFTGTRVSYQFSSTILAPAIRACLVGSLDKILVWELPIKFISFA